MEFYLGVGDEGLNVGFIKRDCWKWYVVCYCGGIVKGRKYKKNEKLRKLIFCLKKKIIKNL